MEPFKVICKADGKSWMRDNGMKATVTKKFFGLIRSTIIGKDLEKVHGPSKDEICIVVNVRTDDGYYKLAGYTQFGWYTPLPFIRLDEFTETQKEIAKKADLVSN